MHRRRPRCFTHWALAACFLAAGSAIAQDRDRVTVKYMPAPVPLAAFETMDVQFERRTSAAPSIPVPPDKFFDAIDGILASHAITSNWQYVYPDGAYIRITVETGGRAIVLSSAHTLYERDGRNIATERGLVARGGRDPKQVIAQESKAFRSRRLAFEKILALVNARVNEALGR
ncbi:MAG: hypothetical protein WCE38_07855 [Burkholderiales bacterium]